MGRYTTVQAYADNNPSMRTVGYDQTKGTTASASSATVETEKVHNPYGSTAGAGSGEFHTYRHARARELQRLKELDQNDAEQRENKIWKEKVDGWKMEEEHKREKRKRKRARGKAAKVRKMNLKLNGVNIGEQEQQDENDEEEFEYTPMYNTNSECKTDDKRDSVTIANKANVERSNEKSGREFIATSKEKVIDAQKEESNGINQKVIDPCQVEVTPPFSNDGSFMELMKAKLGQVDSIAAKKE